MRQTNFSGRSLFLGITLKVEESVFRAIPEGIDLELVSEGKFWRLYIRKSHTQRGHSPFPNKTRKEIWIS